MKTSNAFIFSKFHIKWRKIAFFMTYLISVLVIISSAIVGKLLGKKLKTRDMFYKSYLQLLERLKNNLLFKSEPTHIVFEEFLKTSEMTNKTIFKIIFDLYTSGKIKTLSERKEFYFLTNDEKLSIIAFFEGLGLGSKEVELANIESMYLTSKNLPLYFGIICIWCIFLPFK